MPPFPSSALAGLALWAICAILLAPACAAPLRAADGTPGSAAYAHPQSLVAIDGARRLNLFCLGQGSPAVMLEAGSGGSTLDWRSVQGTLARHTRTCSYDRAGYGFSDPARARSDAVNAVDDLHRLVIAAKQDGPIILVGHSNGGLYATLYAETYPADLAGLVLVDPGFPGQQDYDAYGLSPAKAAELKAWTAGLVAHAADCVAQARTGALTAQAPNSSPCLDDPPNPDPLLHYTLNNQYASVAYQAANLSEFEGSFAAAHGRTLDDRELASAPQTLGSLPLIVLTASRHAAPIRDFTPREQALFYAAWRQGHDALASRSSRGRNLVIGNSGHFIQNDQPEAVLHAVLAMTGTTGQDPGATPPRHDP